MRVGGSLRGLHQMVAAKRLRLTGLADVRAQGC